jgi:hypothetical protein
MAPPSGGGQDSSDASRASSALPSPLDSVDDMRSTAKWTLAAVGVVGAALISGGPLVAVGKVHGLGDTFRALLGLVIVLAGVGIAIWFTSQVLLPRLTTPDTVRTDPRLAELRRRIEQEPAQFMGVAAEKVEDLFALQERLRGIAVDLAGQAAREKDPHRRAKIAAQVTRVESNEEVVASYSRWLIALGHAWLVRADLERSRLWTIGGGVIVAIGAVLFFTATSSGPTYVPVMTPSPAPTATATPFPAPTR